MKKFLVILGALMIFSSNCFAMTFSQPVELGSASATDASFYTYETKGAKYNKNGIAKFGDGIDAIWFYQRPATTQYCYGGSSLDKTFPFLSAYGCEFYRIKTDDKLTLYMVHEWQFDITGEKYILLGRRADGVFVKYFDTSELNKNYFSKPKTRADVPCYTGWNCKGDEISVIYQRMKDRKFVNEGEFRFKWDDKAQWFGIEQVVY